MGPGITNQINSALAAGATQATGLVALTASPNIPWTGKFPFWVLGPTNVFWVPVGSMQVGDDYRNPTFWGAHYLIHTDPTANIDTDKATTRARDDVDLFRAWIGLNPLLQTGAAPAGLVEGCGDYIHIPWHADGLYVEFGGRICLGVFMLISVYKMREAFGCAI